MRLWLLLVLFMLISITPISQANELWLIIVNQYGEPISDKVQVIVIGGRAEPYNATYWFVKTNASKVLVKVYRLGLCVGEFQLRPNGTYRLRVLVSNMLIQAPRSLTIRVKLLGTNQSWLLTGESSYILEDLPCGTYEFEIVGTGFRKVIYWEGGVISIGRSYEVDFEYILKLTPIALAPIVCTGVYELKQRRRRHKPKRAKPKHKPHKPKVRQRARRRVKEGEPRTLAEALLMTEV
ncbi:MAG: hypothetical protein DRN15_07195 [Thermoprotei archaeon]|nr:MAG: hypothetical protein DRN15_07195 [Thermoprotei archaeon]